MNPESPTRHTPVPEGAVIAVNARNLDALQQIEECLMDEGALDEIGDLDATTKQELKISIGEWCQSERENMKKSSVEGSRLTWNDLLARSSRSETLLKILRDRCPLLRAQNNTDETALGESPKPPQALEDIRGSDPGGAPEVQGVRTSAARRARELFTGGAKKTPQT